MSPPVAPPEVSTASPAQVPKRPVLTAEGVRVRFGGVEALAGVDLAVDEGEVVSIIGPNGAGKSTLFNVICGITSLTAGNLFFVGHRPKGSARKALAVDVAAAVLVASLACLLLYDASSLWAQSVLEPHRGRLVAQRRHENYAEAATVVPSFWGAMGEAPYVAAERQGWACRRGTLSKSFGSLPDAIQNCEAAKKTQRNVANGNRLRAFGQWVVGAAVMLRCLRRQRARRTPQKLAREGLARTFQNIRLFDDLSARDNVLVVLEHAARAGSASADDLLDRVQLRTRGDQLAGALSYGERRRLEIARALALQPRLLLLDEPAAGMHAGETAELTTLLRRLRSEGVAIMLIEHDMQLVMAVSDRVVVLDHGASIATGTPEAIVNDARVIAAYLGQNAAAEAPFDNEPLARRP